MIGKTYIDNIDIFERYGVFVAKDGFAGLVSYPPLKTPEENNWHEDNGVEVDLLAPKLDTKSFDMKFGATDYFTANMFIEHLAEGAYHNFRFEEIGINRKLRFVSYPTKKVGTNLTTFTLRFADDFPLEGFTTSTPAELGKFSNVEIDDKDLLHYYSVFVLEGIVEEINKTPNVKQNLLVNNSVIEGANYDDDLIRQRFEAKQINLKCLYTGKILNNGRYWWQDYYNLLYDLVQPNERTFYEGFDFNELPCYYVSSKVDKFRVIGDKVWCEFTLELMLTDFDVEVYFLLSTEDGRLITDEDGETFINVRKEWP